VLTQTSADETTMRRFLRRTLLVSVLALVIVPTAGAELLLAVHGDRARMRSLTGQRSDGELWFLGWGRGQTWGGQFEKWWPKVGDVPVFSLTTSTKTVREKITPRGIAQGQGDGYLRALNRAINDRGLPIIVRPLAEMNGHWNPYSAYNANGTLRNKAHSQKNFRRAFKRIYLILHGGDRDTINRRLSSSGMPGIATSLPENPTPMLRVLWNPQGFGSPNVPGNRAHVYYPGDAYVDIVGNDLYESSRFSAQWDANLALFRRYRDKPYAFGEFGLWGVDHPSFVRRMARFIRNHDRVVLATYFSSEKGSIFDLGSKPSSRAAYRRYITPLNR
jgi:hypothetical protein